MSIEIMLQLSGKELQQWSEEKQRRTKMEINKEAEKEIKKKIKYLKKKIDANCTDSQVVELALAIANRVGGDWAFACEYVHRRPEK